MSEASPRQRALAVVVEDDPILRLETVDFFTDEGFEVIEAGNTAQALQRIEHLADFHVLFSDIRMPGSRDGLALAHEVAARFPDARIVICSALPQPNAGVMPVGALFVGKPFLPASVRKLLR